MFMSSASPEGIGDPISTAPDKLSDGSKPSLHIFEKRKDSVGETSSRFEKFVADIFYMLTQAK
jgi:hypothetical protein